MEAKKIALLVIGQEILSGKIKDTNTPYAAEKLHSVGANLARIVVVPDDLDVICETVKELSEKFDYVITSGGIGPTPDDVTIHAVAKAFNQKVVRHTYIETVVTRHYQTADLTAAQARLTEVPANAELIVLDPDKLPQIVVNNIYIMPGVPHIFQEHLDKVLDKFKGDIPHLTEILVDGLETKLTPGLNRAVRAFPQVAFGSYPNIDPNDKDNISVKITMESTNPDLLNQAKQFLLKVIPSDMKILSEKDQ